MVWFFARGDQVLELETRYDNETSEYLVDLRGPDVDSPTERFTDAAAFRTYLVDLEESLGVQR